MEDGQVGLSVHSHVEVACRQENDNVLHLNLELKHVLTKNKKHSSAT